MGAGAGLGLPAPPPRRRSAGRPAAARIELFDRVLEADFGPFEIKTFRVPRDGGDVAETNLLEWE